MSSSGEKDNQSPLRVSVFRSRIIHSRCHCTYIGVVKYNTAMVQRISYRQPRGKRAGHLPAEGINVYWI